MSRIKICGLFRLEDISFVNEAMPDFIGFVFAKSRRLVTAELAERMRSKLNPSIKAVGVFVDAPMEEVANQLKKGTIDIAQLHGNEDEEYIRQLKDIAGCPIIKAVSVKCYDDVKIAQGSPADYLLLDHGKGGTGEAFNWNLAEDCQTPFFLAGGIHAGNVELAIKKLNPYAVDLSSGVETDGIKDKEKILEIVRRVRNV